MRFLSVFLCASLSVFTPTFAQVRGEPEKLLSAADVDCSKLKKYSERKSCEDEQAKERALLDITDSTGTRLGDRIAWKEERAPVSSILKRELTCERFDMRPANHDTITVKDLAQDFDGDAIILHMVVENNYMEEDIPRSYVERMLPQTFVAKLSNGKTFKLTYGEWKDDDIRVRGRKPYRVRFTLRPADSSAIVSGVDCLVDG